MGHICPTYKESFQVRWDNGIPLFLHAVIYLEVSLFRWTSQNAFFRVTAVYKWYCVQCCIAALYTVSFVHGCFAGKRILAGSTEWRYFKVDGCMEKKWDTVTPADLKRLFLSETYMFLVTKGLKWSEYIHIRHFTRNSIGVLLWTHDEYCSYFKDREFLIQLKNTSRKCQPNKKKIKNSEEVSKLHF